MMNWGGGFSPTIFDPIAILAGAGVIFYALSHRHWRRTSLNDPNPLAKQKLSSPEVDPLTILRNRYAGGEIDHEEFESRLEGLIKTEHGDPNGK